jgi:hypothetical protein
MTPTTTPPPAPLAKPAPARKAQHHILLDIEALGVRPGSAIVQLGAVAFCPRTGALLGEPFHRHILPHAKLHTELRTLHWHTERGTWPPAPPAEPVTLEEALAGFSRWVEETGRPHTWWSWGSTYDFPLLDAACHVLGCEPPWNYWQTACARTVWRMAFPYGKTAPRPHHALEDSIAAVKDLHQAIRKCREEGPDESAATAARPDDGATSTMNPAVDAGGTAECLEPEAIAELYPRRQAVREAVRHIARHIADGVDARAIADGTRAIAEVIRQLPSGHLNAYVPSAEKFFAHRRWEDDPRTWLRLSPANGPHATARNGGQPEKLSLGGRTGRTIRI